jgi:splicing factor U2AF 65 kDa subunit
MITFRSYEEEREWVEERRRKRLARPSKFDIQPNPALAVADAAAASLAAFQNNPMLLSAAAAAQAVAAAQAAAAAAAAAAQQTAGGPQQTRHSRRLYVGNLPLYVTEEQLHQEFKRAIETAHVGPPLSEDPILSVYINHERRFCFLEFKTVEMTSACMALDGMHIAGGVAVKVKRPNDYNEMMAPKIHPSSLPVLDVSRLGIVSSTVQDGPNKVFIGGLHYHLTDSQVLDLLQAFGKLKAFHLVKGDSHDASMSKGYCFAEYVDPAVTPIAIHGLHGMDIGGGKTLTARLAGGRGMTMDPSSSMGGVAAAAAVIPAAPPGVVLPPDRTIVAGYDIEAMVDAAMGQGTMPSAPVYKDALGLPLTRIVGAFAPPPIVPPPILAALGALPGLTPPPPPPPPQLPPFQQQQQQQQVPLYGMNMNVKTRILVLHNMVQAEDLATTQDYQALTDEVREECAKYGNLLAIKIPRAPDDKIEPSAIQKIFLEYATALDAEKAEAELAGRQFGNQVVQVSYFAEEEFKAGRLR